jgi:transcriptional regulator with XRE-family HTH domain
MSDHDALPAAFSQRVGERLRAIRRQKRLSLHDVEAASNQEFKASVLGAYERGERAISVLRLQRLARIYDVPVDQLLPSDGGEHRSRAALEKGGKVAIDLTRLSRMPGDQFALLARYLRLIQVQRQDFNGKVLTVRNADLMAIACFLGIEVDDAPQTLDELGLRYQNV